MPTPRLHMQLGLAETFSRLLAQDGVQVAGRDFALSNGRTDGRDSVFVGGSAIGAGEVDQLVINGLPIVSAMNGPSLPGTPDTDSVNGTPSSWPTEGTLIQLLISDGYTGWNNNPASTFARTFEMPNPNITCNGQSSTQCNIAGITLTGSPVADTPFVLALDWTSTERGARFGLGTRQTSAAGITMSGKINLGNRNDTLRPFHGGIATVLVPYVVTENEFPKWYRGLLNNFGGVQFST